MRKVPLFLFLFGMIYSSLGQEAEYFRPKKRTGKVNITPAMNFDMVLYNVSGVFENARKLIYTDTINGYRVEVDKSMELQETRSFYNFCFTIPRENAPDNAICINSTPLENFKDLNEYKFFLIENPEYLNDEDKSWHFGEISRLVSYEKEKFYNYDSYKAIIDVGKKQVLSQFIFVETDRSFLWINFTADFDTFDSDIRVFKKFLKNFEILD